MIKIEYVLAADVTVPAGSSLNDIIQDKDTYVNKYNDNDVYHFEKGEYFIYNSGNKEWGMQNNGLKLSKNITLVGYQKDVDARDRSATGIGVKAPSKDSSDANETTFIC